MQCLFCTLIPAPQHIHEIKCKTYPGAWKSLAITPSYTKAHIPKHFYHVLTSLLKECPAKNRY